MREPLGPPRPSSWDRLWRPFLHESLGWFIGAFLILAGTFYFVADAWASMTSLLRALTVFGLASGWTLAFAAWARFLGRKETTKPASKVLWRIAAAVAPLATVALGPIVGSAVAWPFLGGWSLVAAALAWRVARDSDEAGATPLAAAIGLATFVLGAAPSLATVGHAAWLPLLVVALAFVSWREGARAEAGQTRFAVVAMGWAVLLVAARVHVALAAVGAPMSLGMHAVTVSALGAAALFLRRDSQGRRAADVVSVLTVGAQTALLVPAFFAPAPAFVVATLLAMVSALRLARERRSPASARWLVPAYAFAYVAFQRIDQLVPAIVITWFQQLKTWLGYASAPLPPSYGSVYAALFVIVVGVYAAVRYGRSSATATRIEMSMLLRCTAGASLFFGALALASLQSDPRPAVLAVPALMALTLALGAWRHRIELTIAGSVLSVAAGVAFFSAWNVTWPMAALALVLGALSTLRTRSARLAMSAAAAALVAGVLLLRANGADALVSLALASVAALLVARNLDDRRALAAAWAVPAVLVAQLESPLALALAALGAMLAVRREAGHRSRTLWPVAAACALAAPVWHLAFVQGQGWFGLVALVSALALGVGARRLADSAWSRVAECASWLLVLASVTPWQSVAQPWPFYSPHLALVAAGTLALGASISAVRRGRQWQSVLVASGALAVALWSVVLSWSGSHATEAHVLGGAVALLATPALAASLTVPLAAVLGLLIVLPHPIGLLALSVALTAVALLEESELAWRFVLNRAQVAWAACLSSLLVLGLTLALHPDFAPLVAGLALVSALAWQRATRSALAVPAGVALSAVAGFMSGGLVVAVAPAAAVLASRLVPLSAGVGAGVNVRALRLGSLLVSLLCAALSVVWPEVPAWAPLAWAGALLLLGGEAPAANVIAAALVSLAVPAAHVPAAFVLMAIATGAHHRPRVVERVLGASNVEFVVASASLSAVVAAAVVVGQTGVAAQPLLALSVLVVAVLLGLPYALIGAVLALAVDLPEAAHLDLVLRPSWQVLAIACAGAAVVLRSERAASWYGALWRTLGAENDVSPSRPWWVAAFVLAALAVPSTPWLALLPLGLLLVTPSRIESALALGLSALAVVLSISAQDAALALAASGAVLAWLGVWFSSRLAVARVWHHAGWVLSAVSLALVGGELRDGAVPLVWGLGAVTAWAAASRRKSRRWIGWLATLLSAHVVLAHLGLVLSTGAPRELILPWFGFASALLAGVALWRGEKVVGQLIGWLAVAEVLSACALLSGGHAREGFVALVAGVVLVVAVLRAVVEDDDAGAAWLGQGAVAVTVMALRRVGAGVEPDVLDAWLALVLGLVANGLALFLRREDRVESARALSAGAVVWPLLGLFALPWAELLPSSAPSSAAGLAAGTLLALAAHFTWLSRTGQRRLGSLGAAAGFNGAMLTAYLASGWHEPQYLAIPAGLSVLALTRAFREELSLGAQVKLRAFAMAGIYAAVAWQPLAFPTTGGLVLCAFVCVAGVAAGAALRIRSYVLLGTGFLVTTVVATLVRYGVQEPRLGALFLSALGLLVVGFMVLITTRRAELQERFAAMQRMLSQWEG